MEFLLGSNHVVLPEEEGTKLQQVAEHCAEVFHELGHDVVGAWHNDSCWLDLEDTLTKKGQKPRRRYVTILDFLSKWSIVDSMIKEMHPRDEIKIMSTLYIFLQVFCCSWLTPYLFASGLMGPIAVAFWWDLPASILTTAFVLLELVVGLGLPQWAYFVVGSVAQVVCMAREQVRLHRLLKEDAWALQVLNDWTLQAFQHRWPSHESIKLSLGRRLQLLKTSNPGSHIFRRTFIVKPVFSDARNSLVLAFTWTALGNYVFLQLCSAFCSRILFPVLRIVGWPLIWIFLQFLWDPSWAEVSLPAASDDAGRGSLAGIVDPLSAQMQSATPSQQNPAFAVLAAVWSSPSCTRLFIPLILSYLIYSINKYRDLNMALHYATAFMRQIVNLQTTLDCDSDFDSSDDEEWEEEVSHWDGYTFPCCQRTLQKHCATVFGPSMTSTVYKLRGMRCFQNPVQFLEAGLQQWSFQCITIIGMGILCCVGLVVSIFKFLVTGLFSALHNSVVMFLELAIYMMEGGAAVAPGWIQWLNTTIWRPVSKVMHYSLVGIGACTHVAVEMVLDPAVKVGQVVLKYVGRALSSAFKNSRDTPGSLGLGKRKGKGGSGPKGKGGLTEGGGRLGGKGKAGKGGVRQSQDAVNSSSAEHNSESQNGVAMDEMKEGEVEYGHDRFAEHSEVEAAESCNMQKEGSEKVKTKPKKRKATKLGKGKGADGMAAAAQDGSVDGERQNDEFRVVGKGGKGEKGPSGGAKGRDEAPHRDLQAGGMWGGDMGGSARGGQHDDIAPAAAAAAAPSQQQDDDEAEFDEERILASLLHEEEEEEDQDTLQMMMSLLPDLAEDLARSPASSDVHPPKAAATGGDGCVICWEGQCTHVLAPCGHKALCERCANMLRISIETGGQVSQGNRKLCPICRSQLEYPFVMQASMIKNLTIFPVNDE